MELASCVKEKIARTEVTEHTEEHDNIEIVSENLLAESYSIDDRSLDNSEAEEGQESQDDSVEDVSMDSDESYSNEFLDFFQAVKEGNFDAVKTFISQNEENKQSRFQIVKTFSP